MVIASKPNNDRHFLSFSRKLFLSVISLLPVLLLININGRKSIKSSYLTRNSKTITNACNKSCEIFRTVYGHLP